MVQGEVWAWLLLPQVGWRGGPVHCKVHLLTHPSPRHTSTHPPPQLHHHSSSLSCHSPPVPLRWRFIFSLPSMQSLLPSLDDQPAGTKNIKKNIKIYKNIKKYKKNIKVMSLDDQQAGNQPASVESLADRTMQRLRKLFPTAAALR